MKYVAKCGKNQPVNAQADEIIHGKLAKCPIFEKLREHFGREGRSSPLVLTKYCHGRGDGAAFQGTCFMNWKRR